MILNTGRACCYPLHYKCVIAYLINYASSQSYKVNLPLNLSIYAKKKPTVNRIMNCLFITELSNRLKDSFCHQLFYLQSKLLIMTIFFTRTRNVYFFKFINDLKSINWSIIITTNLCIINDQIQIYFNHSIKSKNKIKMTY